ncbi:MAG: TraR/DksA C4-type zinc finger protein [Parcubacteria group bacterium]
MTKNQDKFKEMLLSEKKLVEKELEDVGQRNPDNPDDWEPKPARTGTPQADENTAADSIEDYKDNTAILNTLETRYKEITSALERIESGTYGLCEVCGKEIDEERLTANPSAPTCREHMA